MFVQPRITKTYFYTSQKENRFPPEFIQSKNPRIIKVISCKLNYLGFLVGDVKVHASFIERDHYTHTVCVTYYFCIMANSTNNYAKKYDYKSLRQDFKIWFTDLKNNIIEPDSFLLEMLLIY